MKLHKEMQTYCKYCNLATEHSVKPLRKGKDRADARGNRKYDAVKKGFGGSPRTPKKHVYKIGKRVTIILECKKCGKKHSRTYPSRTKKKLEII